MKLDKFKLIGEDNDNYHIEHPSGKKMQISKSGLSKPAHDLVLQLRHDVQKFEDGGSVESETSDDNSGTNTDNANFNDVAAQGRAQADQAPQSPSYDLNLNNVRVGDSSVPNAAPGISANMEQASSAPQQGLPGNVPGTQAAIQESINANNAMAKSIAGQGAAEHQALQDVENANAVNLVSHQQRVDELRAKDEQLEKAFNDKAIDPDRYWSNKSIPSKISAMIGLILGGASAGVTGGPNLAAQHLNNMINADIESQRNDKSNAMNLWKMNREALGNENAAYLATQNQMYAALSHKLQDAAAQFKGPQAAAQYQGSNALLHQQMAQNNFKLSLMGGPTKEYSDPSKIVPWLVPSDRQKEVFNEIQRAQNTKAIAQNILHDFDKSAQDVRPLSGGRLKNVLPFSESAYVGNLRQHMLTTMSDLEGSVRQTVAEGLEHSFIPHMGNSDEEIKTKRQGLVDYLNAKSSAPTAKGFGIDLSKYPSTTPTQQQNPMEGKTAVNPQGQRIQMINGQWVNAR